MNTQEQSNKEQIAKKCADKISDIVKQSKGCDLNDIGSIVYDAITEYEANRQQPSTQSQDLDKIEKAMLQQPSAEVDKFSMFPNEEGQYSVCHDLNGGCTIVSFFMNKKDAERCVNELNMILSKALHSRQYTEEDMITFGKRCWQNGYDEDVSKETNTVLETLKQFNKSRG